MRTYGKPNDSRQSAPSTASPKYCCTNILCFLPYDTVLLFQSTGNTCRDDRHLQSHWHGSCCGDSHMVSIGQPEMFTHILLLTRVRERKRRESLSCLLLFHSPRLKRRHSPSASLDFTPAPSQHHSPEIL